MTSDQYTTAPAANWTIIAEDAVRTAGMYLSNAIEKIDAEFGEGYAKENPRLVGTVILAMTQDYHSGSEAKARLDSASKIEDALRAIAEALGEVSKI